MNLASILNPDTSLYAELLEGTITRYPLPIADLGRYFVPGARYYVPPGEHQVAEQAWVVFKRNLHNDVHSCTTLTEIHVKDELGRVRDDYIWGKQLAIGLFELNQAGHKSINIVNVSNNPVILEFLKAVAADTGVHHTDKEVVISDRLINHLAKASFNRRN